MEAAREKAVRAALRARQRAREAIDRPGSRSTPDDRRPPLRIVRPPESEPVPAALPPSTPLTGAADPRWVLAVRTAEYLQGAVLPPEERQRLLRLGRMLGLSVFDSNLIIAIVQDQARRGRAPHECPRAGAGQLGMIPLPVTTPWLAAWRQRKAQILTAVAAIVTVEVLAILWLF